MALPPAQPLSGILAALLLALETQAGDVRAQFARTLELLFLTLLIRLVRRQEAQSSAQRTPEIRILARALRQRPPVGDPALAVALGVVPGWIMRATRNRGMRAALPPPRLRQRRPTARPPPRHDVRKNPPGRGANLRRLRYDIKTKYRTRSRAAAPPRPRAARRAW